MPVIDPYAGTNCVIDKISKVKEELVQIRSLLSDKANFKSNRVTDGSLTLISRNNMIYWNKQDDAARYRLRLFLDSLEIDSIEIDREKSYHTFTDLVGDGFYVRLEVEDRSGKIIRTLDMEI